MGLFNALRRASALTAHQSLTQQFSAAKAQGFDDTQAGAVLIASAWQLPAAQETVARAVLLSGCLGDLVIGLLMFSRRIGVDKAMQKALTADPFWHTHGCLYFTAVPLTDFARKHMNRIWNRQNVSDSDASDAAFAAFYATLIVPFAVDAWIMLAELKQRGFCPDIDNRDHVSEGLNNTRAFLETATNIDPRFHAMLSQGIKHLSQMR
jgi:hypothetical protein